MKLALPPQPMKRSYYEPVEEGLLRAFFKIIFEPVIKILKDATPQAKGLKRELKNSPITDHRALLDALKSGKIQYAKGEFSGEFSATFGRALRAIGASFNPKSKTYVLTDVPRDVIEASNGYQTLALEAHNKLQATLLAAQQNVEAVLHQFTPGNFKAGESVDRVQTDFAKTVVGLGFEEATNEEKNQIAEAYTKNLKLYIKDFADQEIVELRGIVEENSRAGMRFDSLIDKVQQRYEVSKSKAKFLARQETGLFMANYREQKFKDAGIKRYVWVTAGDARVRADHKLLDGRVFEYDNPPIVDAATGERNNPGKEYGCRCVDRPLLETYKTENIQSGDKYVSA